MIPKSELMRKMREARKAAGLKQLNVWIREDSDDEKKVRNIEEKALKSLDGNKLP